MKKIFAVALLHMFCCGAAFSAQHGAIATVHPLATDAALAAFKRGGNAVDASVAAALTLGVVDGHNSGIGGGCFLLIRTPRGKVVAIDGRETAPGAATRDMLIRNGKADTSLSQSGPLAIGVPGSLAAYDYALKNFGKLSLRELLLPAGDLAEKGFALNATYAERLKETAGEIAKFPATKEIFLKSEGEPFKSGEIIKQRDLARSYRAIAEQGIGWFYKTEFPEQVDAWMKSNGGVITAEDFQKYQIVIREPLVTHYRGFIIYGFPPPSSGGVHVAQILNILENFQWNKYRAGSVEEVHIVSEAMKLAFADRAFWLGDPAFFNVPVGLIDPEYGKALAKRIDPSKAGIVQGHSIPPEADSRFFGKHTTHFSAADDEGFWIACTTTVNTSFGSKVVVPGTGIILNNQMDDFAIEPGVANYFGLVGAEANAVAPGKRPLSSMSPTIVEKQGEPVLSLGAAGGPTIISQTVINLINILDFHMSIDEALATPRFHHQWRPDEIRIERRAGEKLMENLKAKGHNVKPVVSMGAAQIVQKTGSAFKAAHDPRLQGKATAF